MEIKRKLDERITFADFVTLAACFMACGALWWRVGSAEESLKALKADTAPLIQEHKAREVQRAADVQAAADTKKKLEDLEKAVSDIGLSLARIEGATLAPKDGKR